MTDLTYCANGCNRINQDNRREPLQASHGRLCAGCDKRLDRWLREIPDRYALLPDYVLPSATIDKNPEIKAAKKTHSPAPLRLAALDLLDERRGRKWQGTEPTEDRRGALGTLHAIADYIRTGRNTSTQLRPTVSREADTIRLNLDWLEQDELVKDAYDELRILHRELGDAVGQYPPKAVGACYVISEDSDEECGGPLLPTHTGVACPRCGSRWGYDDLRLLGMGLDVGETA